MGIKTLILVSTIFYLSITPVVNTVGSLQENTVKIYVSATGSDTGNGTLVAPFLTLEKARDQIREIKLANNNQLKSPIDVILSEGDYELQSSFVLAKEDSGTSDYPITYKAQQGALVNIVGGVSLENNRFTNVKDEKILKRIQPQVRDKIYQFDLNEIGITDLGSFDAIEQTNPSPAELFSNNENLTMARWPNFESSKTGAIVSHDPIAFKYTDERIQNWKTADNAWLMGMWMYNWSEQAIKLDHIDTNKKEVWLKNKHYYDVDKNRSYYIFNLLEELDIPGEWYIDYNTKILYYYPVYDIRTEKLQVSLLNKELISIQNLSNVRFEGLTFEASRFSAITGKQCNNIVIGDCTFRNLGQKAVVLGASNKCIIDGCNVYNTGKGGISIDGGSGEQRAQLTSAENDIKNNNFFNYSRLYRTYTPAVSISGVGNIVENNLIHNAPHNAILFAGNNHIIRNNEIFEVVRDSDDAGAIYAGRSFEERGTVIENNYFHDIYGLQGGISASAVYFDDMLSGNVARNNIFNKVAMPIHNGGGHDVIIENNLFIDKVAGSSMVMKSDNRGMTSAAMWKNIDPFMLDKLLKNTPYYKDDVWTKAYPTLATILDNSKPGQSNDIRIPWRTSIQNNIAINHGEFSISNDTKQYGAVKDNIRLTNQIKFVDKAKQDFTLTKASIDYLKKHLPNFVPINMNDMGLKIDMYRQTMPQLGTFSLYTPIKGQVKMNNGEIPFRWQSSLSADYYIIQVSDKSDFSHIVVEKQLSKNACTMNELKASKTYYWRVFAYTKARQMSPSLLNSGEPGVFKID